MTQAIVPETQRAAYFPEISKVAGENYAQVAQKALMLYNANYTDQGTYNFLKKALEVRSVIETWTLRHDLVVKGTTQDQPSMEALRVELDKKLVQYIAFRHIRDETQRIVGVFDEAISYLTLPRSIDPYTIEVLRLSGIDVQAIDKRIATIFGTVQQSQKQSLKDQLVTKKRELAEFHTQMVSNCTLLRKALEPLASYSAPVGYGIGSAFSWGSQIVGQTPYVNNLVQNHDITRAKAHQQQDEHKE